MTLGEDCDQLLCWVLDLLDGVAASPPAFDLPRFAAAGFASGLTAAIGALAPEAALPPAWREFAAEQRRAVAERQARFGSLLPVVLGSLSEAGVPALPVKGAVLALDRQRPLWPVAEARPMSDIDLVVAPADRQRAAAALVAAGLTHHDSTGWEDTFLAWGDGGVGRIDGESPHHNGKVEIHPGWVERLHNYLVDDRGWLLAAARPAELNGVGCLRLDDVANAVHVVGHLSACVVRGEVRALNVADAVLALGALDRGDHARLRAVAAQLDPRLVGPGLWLVDHYRPGCLPEGLAADAVARLGRHAMARLSLTPAHAVLRDPAARTTAAWRLAFATTATERARVARQLIWPAHRDRAATGPAPAAQLGRLRRLVEAATTRRPTAAADR